MGSEMCIRDRFKRRENAVWLYADELGYDKLAEKAVDLSRDFLNGKQ